jgi:hypothetical protein
MKVNVQLYTTGYFPRCKWLKVPHGQKAEWAPTVDADTGG